MIYAIKSGLCVFIHSSLNKKMHSFHKRFFVLSLCIILAFTTISKPREVKAFAITLTTVCGIVAVASGIVVTGHELYTWWKETHPDDSEEDCLEYFKNNISIDGDGNYVLTDNAKLTINNMMDSYNESVGYIDAFPIDVNGVLASAFSSNTDYSQFCKLLKAFPDCLFVPNRNNTVTVDGVDYSAYECRVICGVYCGISNDITINKVTCSFYTEDWKRPDGKFIYVLNDGKGFAYYSVELDKFVLTSDLSFPMSDVRKEFDNAGNGFLWSRTGMSSDLFGANPDYIYSAHQGSIPIFVSEYAMKNGTAGTVKGNYIPNYYTGQPITNNIVDSHDVSNVINNYYDNDPDNPGGGDDSESGLSGFLGAIRKLGTAILKILNTLIDIIADAIEVVVNGFTSVTDLINNGFTNFITALFPFIPNEWIVCITLSLSLGVFGVVLKLFHK